MKNLTIKIAKSMCRMEYNEYLLTIYAHLCLTKSYYGCTDTNIEILSHSLTYPISKNNIDGPQAKIKNAIQQLREQNYIQVQCNTHMTNLTHLHIDFPEETIDNNYVLLSVDEMVQLIQCAQTYHYKVHQLLNVYMVIKSFINMSAQCLHYTTINDNQVMHILNINKSMFMKIKSILLQTQMLYEYQINTIGHITDYHGKPITHIYTIQQYPQKLIEQEFIT